MEEPDPLVAADVDLRGMAWMPYYGDHLSRSEMNSRATDAGYRAAHNLWWAAWNNVPAASLPDDELALARFADLGRDVKQFRKVKLEALHGFVKCSDGRLYHRFLAPLAMDAWERRSKQRERKRTWRNGIGVKLSEWDALRETIFDRDGRACKSCGDTENLNCDHIIPVAKGGKTDLSNLQTLCARCNKRKLNRLWGQTGDVPGTLTTEERGQDSSDAEDRTDDTRARLTGQDRTGKDTSLSISNEISERARGARGSLSKDEKLLDEWRDAAEAERAQAGLAAVDLRHEWAKLRARDAGEITRNRWVEWALKARADAPKARADKPSATGHSIADPWEQRLDQWTKNGWWMPNFGPKPDEPNCWAPCGLIDAAVERRKANDAEALHVSTSQREMK